MYKIITSPYIAEIEAKVASALSKGWLLSGSIFQIESDDTHIHRTGSVSSHKDFRQRITFAQAIYLPQTKEPTCLT